MLEAKPHPTRGLALGAVPPIEPGATSQGSLAAVADMAALLTEITRAPRVVGTAGYERGLDAVEATLRADVRLSNIARRRGFLLPGLSYWALARQL